MSTAIVVASGNDTSKSAVRNMTATKIFRLAAILIGIPFMFACGRDVCGGDNLLTAATPAMVESFEVRDRTNSILWKIQTTRPASLTQIRLGEVPAGFVQTAPPRGAQPRKFVKGEELSTFTVMTDRTLFHRGHAIGENEFCGGLYESTPRGVK